ncbi:MAG TPA: threonine/serine dehydratase [Acidimicrobiales bacterium]|nr:threonine/serine dehydratase [Acidimicrobiales bacterium]
MPTSKDLEQARERLAGRVRRTPVIELGDELAAQLATGSARASWSLVLKLEMTQFTGSFKARGALNSLLARPVPESGVVAASGGNHGAAVAWAASTCGVPATIFVPSTSPASKLERIRGYGAELHVVEGHYAEALTASIAHAGRTGARLVHAYDDPDVVAGQSTIGAELLEQVPDADTVLLACGGGGLYAGVALACTGHAVAVPVEPATCPTLQRAVAAGEPVPVDVGGLAADSLGARQAGAIAAAVALAKHAEPRLVDDADIAAARSWLWEHVRVPAEPGGATGLAALLARAYEPREHEKVVVVVSGANWAP